MCEWGWKMRAKWVQSNYDGINEVSLSTSHRNEVNVLSREQLTIFDLITAQCP